jgi:peptidoglycan/LPS O-acetylase OafA/YrhL
MEVTGRLGLGVAGRAAEVAGFQAVIVFFAISGFLLYRPYVAARARDRGVPSTRRYARRRALRILPGYWTVLTLLAIFPGIVGVFSGEWWRYYGYLQLYSERTQGQGIPVAWTLCVEVTFYIALPIWAFAVRRLTAGRGARGLLRPELLPLTAVAAAGVVVQVTAARRLIPRLVGVSLAGQITWMAIGMALAVVSVAAQHDDSLGIRLRAVAERSALCWAVSAIAFVALMPLQPANGLFGLIATIQTRESTATTVAKIALEAVFVTFLLLPAIFGDRRRGLPRRLLAAAPIAYLGVISYSFYLWHLTVVEWLGFRTSGAFSAPGLNLVQHLHFARSLILYLVTLAATVTLASISYRLVELPFLRRKESTRTPS